MPVVLKFDTTPSLHDQVEVEVNGTVLRVNTITLKTTRRIQQLWNDMHAGSAEAIGEGLKTLFNGDTSVLEDVPLTKLKEIIEGAIEAASKPGTEEKNGSGPGAESLPS
ncbi:MAG: hypothetical protein IMZ57_04225 [Acidobacteria bacterium]|nr:hypothetical protein [Acidobacteriota bacterium]